MARIREVIDVQELTSGSSAAPARHLTLAVSHCVVDAANHRGQYVAVGGVEVVAWPVNRLFVNKRAVVGGGNPWRGFVSLS